MAQTSYGTAVDSRYGVQSALCVLCQAPATFQSPSAGGILSDPDASGQRQWSALPEVDVCDTCLTDIIRERVSVGWCIAGGHWGVEFTDCQTHRGWFERVTA